MVQVDPIKHTLKAPGNKCLTPKYDELLSKFAFKFNLRRYIMVNPDGYERTYVSTNKGPADRFWRKNMRPTSADGGGVSDTDSCSGVDLNRNWVRRCRSKMMKSKLKAPGAKRLKLKYDNPVSSFAFKSNLRRYNWGTAFGGVGSSGDPCTDSYRGPAAFSERETQAGAYTRSHFR
jgi:hypothetical protein